MQTCARLIQSNLMHRKDLFELFDDPPDKSKNIIFSQLELDYA